MKSLSVVLTGLCRRPDLVRSTVEALKELEADGMVVELVIATWQDEADKYWSILSGHQGYRITLTPCLKPILEMPIAGSILHQQMTLRGGVDAAEHDLVFRTRSDLRVTASYLRRIIEQYESLPSESARYASERDVVIVPWADLEEPFHIADECFLTTRRTAMGLKTSDIEGIARYDAPMANAHTLFYAPPYWRSMPIFDQFLLAQRRFRRSMNLSSSTKWRVLEVALNHQIYRDMMALYWDILRHDFRVSHGDGEIAFFPRGGARQASWHYPLGVRAETIDEVFTSRFAGYANHIYLHSTEDLPRAEGGDIQRALRRTRKECAAEFRAMMTEIAPLAPEIRPAKPRA